MIEEIKNRIFIIELARKLGLKVNSSGFTFSIYKNEKTPSLKLYDKTNSFYCFATNQGGDVIKFYADYYKIETAKAVRELADLFGITKNEISFQRVKQVEKKEVQTNNKLELLESEKEYFEERSAIIEYEAKYSREKAELISYDLIKKHREETQKVIYKNLYEYCLKNPNEKAIEYLLKERKLISFSINFFKIFTIKSVKDVIEFLKDNYSKDELTISGLFTSNNYFIFTNHQIILPYIEQKEIKYLRARYFKNNSAINENASKYIGLTNFAGNLTAKRFFNLDLLNVIKPYTDLLITEGEFDCIIANQLGYNSIGIAGVSNFPKESIQLLENYNLYLCFDNDEVGEKAIKEISEILTFPFKQIKIKNYKDLNEVIKNEN